MTAQTSAPAAAAASVRLPNLLIIGAAKCGTSALHAYLAHHPQVFMSRQKELQLFNHDDWRERLPWYREQFATDAPVRGESSPAYSMDPWFPDVPRRVREVTPDARIIYLVRDPVPRTVAQYVEHVAIRLEDRGMADALADYESPTNRYVMASRYAYQLDRWREHFADARILVMDQRDLLTRRGDALREVFAFLGVDAGFTTAAFDRRHNERSTKMRANRFGLWLHERGQLMRARDATRGLPGRLREPLKRAVASPVTTPELDDGLRRELEEHLRADADRLRAYTGRSFDHWTV